MLILNSIKSNFTYTITNCTNKICDEEGGICINSSICKCNDYHTTYYKNNLNSIYKLCNYQKKRCIYTALIELFFGFGMGHFYCGRKVNGFLKLIIYSFFCCIGYCSLVLKFKLSQDGNMDENSTLLKFFYYVWTTIFNFIMIWQILDFIIFLFGSYNDGNDIPLA